MIEQEQGLRKPTTAAFVTFVIRISCLLMAPDVMWFVTIYNNVFYLEAKSAEKQVKNA